MRQRLSKPCGPSARPLRSRPFAGTVCPLDNPCPCPSPRGTACRTRQARGRHERPSIDALRADTRAIRRARRRRPAGAAAPVVRAACGTDLPRRQLARHAAQGYRRPRAARGAPTNGAAGLITSWNHAGWIDLPRRIGDKIARLVGAAPGELVVADSTSINLFKVLSAALSLQRRQSDDRHVIVSERSNFPTDLYIAQSLAAAHACELGWSMQSSWAARSTTPWPC